MSQPLDRPTTAVTADEAAAALDRVVGSTTFAGSARHRAFLSAVVGRHLHEPEGEPLKEFALGVDVFGRSPEDFDPQVDNIVRVEARRLRDRLLQYYETEGREDPVVIDIPRGGYGVAIARRPPQAAGQAETPPVVAPVAAATPTAPAPLPVTADDRPAVRRWSPVANLLTVLLVAAAGFAVSSMSRALPELTGLGARDTAATVAGRPVTNLTNDPASEPSICGRAERRA